MDGASAGSDLGLPEGCAPTGRDRALRGKPQLDSLSSRRSSAAVLVAGTGDQDWLGSYLDFPTRRPEIPVELAALYQAINNSDIADLIEGMTARVAVPRGM